MLELVWVNDASTDGSIDEISSLKSDHIKQKLISLPSNIGSYMAVVEALNACTGDVVVVMAADGQDPPKVAFQLVEMLGEYDLAGGARPESSGGFATNLFHRMMRAKVGKTASKNPFEMVAFNADHLPVVVNDPKSRLHLFYFLDRMITRKTEMTFMKRPRQFGSTGWSFTKKASLFVRCWLLF